MLIFKLFTTPVMIAIATLIERRWGPALGGLFTAMPLTAGPISVFIYFEQGETFAIRAAFASMLGYGAIGAFALAFIYAAKFSGRCMQAWALATCAYIAYARLALFLPFWPAAGMAITAAALIISYRLIKSPKRPAAAHKKSPRWDLPTRMFCAAAIVFLTTYFAGALGPAWSGLAGTYPVFGAIIGMFTFVEEGYAALALFWRGMCAGMTGSAVFFFVAVVCFSHLPIGWVYALSLLANLIVNVFCLWLMRRENETK